MNFLIIAVSKPILQVEKRPVNPLHSRPIQLLTRDTHAKNGGVAKKHTPDLPVGAD